MRARLTLRTRGADLQSFITQDKARQADFIGAYRLEGGMLVMNQMQQEVPKRTWELHDSIESRPTASGFVVFPRAPHAIFVEKGTRPHEIRPVKAKALRFFPSAVSVVSGRRQAIGTLAAATLEPIFAKVVHHPGTKPNPFVERTAEKVREPLRRLAQEIWKRVYK